VAHILPGPDLEKRVAALETAVAMLTRKALENGDITINDARAAHGLPAWHEAGATTGDELTAAEPEP